VATAGWEPHPMNMSKREKEHYEIAKRFGVGRPFTRLEFYSLYCQEYPKRISTPIPSDFCINLYPRELRVSQNSCVGLAAVGTNSSATRSQRELACLHPAPTVLA
jgi:hypothetical protein